METPFEYIKCTVRLLPVHQHLKGQEKKVMGSNCSNVLLENLLGKAV